MGRQDKLCEWFKRLPAHQRIDYMCGLLRLCLPLELRFLGSVLEDLARKDFHILRDQENKANLRADLSSNTSSSLSDRKLRAKVITALALMKSANCPCAQVIFDIILQQDLDGLLKLPHSSCISADLTLLLTMAVNHPAFTFHQRNQLAQVLERLQRYMGESPADDTGSAEGRNIRVYASTVAQGCRQSTTVEHATVSEPQYSCEPSQISGASSPTNFRTSSPSSVIAHNDNSCRLAGLHTVTRAPQTASAADPVNRAPQTAPAADHTFQLLPVLSVGDDYSSLRDDPLQQVMHMSKEGCAKAGGPELEVKLKSKPSQSRSPYINGVVGGMSWPLSPTVMYQPLYHQPLAHISHYYIPHLVHAASYFPSPGHMSGPPGPAGPGPTGQTPSPPSSPQLQSAAGLVTDQGHVRTALTAHMLPVGMVALDTQTTLDLNLECAESCSSEDEKSAGDELTSRSRQPGRAQQSQSLPLISPGMVSQSALEAANRSNLIFPAPPTHPHVAAATEPGTSTTPPLFPLTSLGASITCPHMPASRLGLINGYLSEPAPAPAQGAPTVVGPRMILSSRTPTAAQPVHSGLEKHNQMLPPSTQDVQRWCATLGANHTSLSDLPGGVPLPSYIPLAASTPLMALSPASIQVSSTVPAQSSANAPVVLEGGSSYPRMVSSQPRGMHASITSTMPQPTYSSTSHSPIPTTAVYADQVQPPSYAIETSDPGRTGEPSVSPPAQTQSTVTGLKSRSNASSTSSGTPSPPLNTTSHKHTGPSDTQNSWRPSQMLGCILYPTVRHQQQQQAFPNGLVPEFGFVRLPYNTTPSHFPLLYSSLCPPQISTHTAIPPTPTHQISTHTAVPPTPTHQSSTVVGTAADSACYNCGHSGHQVCECPESRMETVSNTFHLTYNPRDPPT